MTPWTVKFQNGVPHEMEYNKPHINRAYFTQYGNLYETQIYLTASKRITVRAWAVPGEPTGWGFFNIWQFYTGDADPELAWSSYRHISIQPAVQAL